MRRPPLKKTWVTLLRGGADTDKKTKKTLFVERMFIRHEVKKAFIFLDLLQRVFKALLRKVTLKMSKFKVGDLVMF